MKQDIRWKQRFENFDRALTLLHEPIDRGIETLSALEMEGTVQRFEVAIELAWNTMKDYLEYQGAIIDPKTPKNVVKEAFAAKILEEGQVWIDMLNHLNLLSHTYSESIFSKFMIALRDRYMAPLDELRTWLKKRSEKE